jgi:hypothetical protein
MTLKWATIISCQMMYEVFVVYICSSRRFLGWGINLGHICRLPNPSQFIISSSHSNRCKQPMQVISEAKITALFFTLRWKSSVTDTSDEKCNVELSVAGLRCTDFGVCLLLPASGKLGVVEGIHYPKIRTLLENKSIVLNAISSSPGVGGNTLLHGKFLPL